MDNIYIYNLKQPCKNRNVEFIDNKDGSVNLDGKRFETMRESGENLESKPRTDI